MKTEITEQERQEIEEAAKKCTVDYYNNVGGYYEDHVLTNEDKMRLMFRFGAEFALTELRKPIEPEPIGRTDEELVQKITDIIESNSWDKINTDLDRQLDFDIDSIATEIAKLLPSSRSQENDVNVELLKDMYEALVIAKNRIKETYSGYPREIAICISEYERITNYEKQIKR